LLERDFLRDVAREKGRSERFCSFHSRTFQHGLGTPANLKRGGRQQFVSWDGLEAEERYALEPASNQTPEDLYDQRWAVKVMEQALAPARRIRLHREGTAIRAVASLSRIRNR
jgi:hypothetical protein